MAVWCQTLLRGACARAGAVVEKNASENRVPVPLMRFSTSVSNTVAQLQGQEKRFLVV